MLEMRAKMIAVALVATAAILPLDLAEADQVGHASWYALYSRTASGEMMNPSELTAAHRSLPFGTRVLVENLNTGRSVVVRINDRGPFIGGRIIDLSKAAAASIGMIDSGVAKVRVTTPGGGAIAALGESESNTKSGGSLAAVDKAETTAVDNPAKGEAAAPRISAKPKTAKAPTASKPKVAATRASYRSKHAKSSGSRGRAVAAKPSAKSSVKTAAKSRTSHGGVAALASKRSARGSSAVASAANPYAILGSAPGFMKSAQARRPG